MCDPGGSTSSRVSSDGARRPIEGDRGASPDQLSDRMRGYSFPSDSKGTHAHVNTGRVIT